MRNTLIKSMTALVTIGLLVTGLSACGGGGGSDASSSDKGRVYFLNHKSEVADQYHKLAKDFTKETGIKVDIVTAATNTLDQTTQSELAKKDAPTILSIGMDNFPKFKKYLLPIQDTDVYKLMDKNGKEYSMKDGKDSFTFPFAAEYYGFIYNKKIINDYGTKPYALVKSVDEIKDYETLKKVITSIHEHKDDLGLKGAVATPSVDASDEHRFVSHMARIPLYYEYRDDDITFKQELKGTYLKNYKDLFDLEVANSPSDPMTASNKTYDDCVAEFSQAQVAFFPEGVWAYPLIRNNKVADTDMGMLPYWMGIKGEEKMGPAAIYDASWAINKKTSKANQEASLKFIKWMVSSEEGKETLSHEMSFSVPFSAFNDKYQPNNVLTLSAKTYEKEGKTLVRSFNLPSTQWGDNLANALLEYTQGTKDWKNVESSYIDGWQKDWKLVKQTTGALPEATKFE